jgi:Arc/MetJ-type ribon-helix-helix transcriptional regulator
MAQRSLRLTDDLAKRINAAVEERGLGSVAAFIRMAIQNELDRAEAQRRIEALEERIATTLARLADDVRKVANGQQAAIALIDSLTKVILTCIPEPIPEAVPATAIGRRSCSNSFYACAGSYRAA